MKGFSQPDLTATQIAARRILDGLEFTLKEQARAFGFVEAVGEDVQTLEDRMSGVEDADTRAKLIIGMNDRMESLAPGDLDAHRKWITARKKEFRNRSIKDEMVSGDFSRFSAAVTLIENVTGW